jgi:anhydro-N-acetylmuramic acid kinase
LETLLAHPYFDQAPPKSTGRDTFHLPWLDAHLHPAYAAADVQATLLELTARSIADSMARHCGGAEETYLCGGGAHNLALTSRLQQLMPNIAIAPTDALGIGADWVEAAAFAWLAQQAIAGQPANLPAATGASGARILGAIYPA